MRPADVGITKRLRRAWRLARSVTATVNETPVIILGKEKSGTTAIASLLAKHTGLSLAHDIRALWGHNEALVRDGNMPFDDVVRRNRGKFSCHIVKEPNLTFIYAQVRERFPDARFVMIVRDPRDNIRSVFNRLGLPGSAATLDPDIAQRIPDVWRYVVFGDTVAADTAVRYVEVAANRWNTAADVYLLHRHEMTLVRYEDFVQHKTETIMHLADTLGLPHAIDVSSAVDVQYQSVGDRSIRWGDFFGGRNLAVIEHLCGTRMREFGYQCVSAASEPEKQCSSV